MLTGHLESAVKAGSFLLLRNSSTFCANSYINKMDKEEEFAELNESNLAMHHSRFSSRPGEEVLLSKFLRDNREFLEVGE
jgi:hypothetical protein